MIRSFVDIKHRVFRMSETKLDSMDAIVWEGKPFQMALKKQPIPHIMDPNDIVIRITTAAICGTDLHTYRGRFGSKNSPWIMGHEGIGTIVEVGDGVKSLNVGDRVTVPGVISCGYCDNCVRGYESYCLTFNPPTIVDCPGMGDDFGPNLGGTQGMYHLFCSLISIHKYTYNGRVLIPLPQHNTFEFHSQTRPASSCPRLQSMTSTMSSSPTSSLQHGTRSTARASSTETQ